MQTFSSILNDLLEARGMSQRDLAVLAHTTEATISRYCHNPNRMPQVDIVIAISKALGVSTDYLLGITPVMNREELSEDLADLVYCYNKASEDDRRVLWAVLDKYRPREYKIAASGQDKWEKKDEAARVEAVERFDTE